jgi:hypothetical protein
VANKVVKLQASDWDVLFPSEPFTISSTTFEVAPLSITGLSVVVKKVTKIIDKVVALDIDLNNLTGNAVKIIEVVSLILSEAPEILTEMSGLDTEDVVQLPLDVAVDLFNHCLDVNLKSQESLTKNFKGLGERVIKFMGNRGQIQ